jgi:hypothetical protein
VTKDWSSPSAQLRIYPAFVSNTLNASICYAFAGKHNTDIAALGLWAHKLTNSTSALLEFYHRKTPAEQKCRKQITASQAPMPPLLTNINRKSTGAKGGVTVMLPVAGCIINRVRDKPENSRITSPNAAASGVYEPEKHSIKRH